jgi:hypothetical protein
VVEVHHVDRLDRGLGVGVGGEQHAAGVWIQVHGLLQELHAVHLRHAVVGEERRDVVAPQSQVTDALDSLGRGVGPDDAIGLAVAAP